MLTSRNDSKISSCDSCSKIIFLAYEKDENKLVLVILFTMLWSEGGNWLSIFIISSTLCIVKSTSVRAYLSFLSHEKNSMIENAPFWVLWNWYWSWRIWDILLLLKVSSNLSRKSFTMELLLEIIHSKFWSQFEL